MGPLVLFDKSAIEMLNMNEAAVFDCLFMSNLCPIYLVEVLADLQKKETSGRDHTKVVSDMARKTPVVHTYPNVMHTTLCLGELLGVPVTMDGRPLLGGGRAVRHGNKLSVVYDEQPEMEAFNRWQKGQFLEVERLFVAVWRQALQDLDLSGMAKVMKSALGVTAAPKNEAEAVQMAQWVLDTVPPFELLKTAFAVLGLPRELFRFVKKRWQSCGYPVLAKHAPYVAHCFLVDVFFFIAIDKGLISPDRPSNKTDIAYLNYLPFTEVFISNDRLHRRLAPYFMRENQAFVMAADLKADLLTIEAALWRQPDVTKGEGLFRLAGQPSQPGLVADLWSRFRPGWRESEDIASSMTPEQTSRLLAELKKMEAEDDGPSITPTRQRLREHHRIAIKRRIPAQRGRWCMLPKDFKKD